MIWGGLNRPSGKRPRALHGRDREGGKAGRRARPYPEARAKLLGSAPWPRVPAPAGQEESRIVRYEARQAKISPNPDPHLLPPIQSHAFSEVDLVGRDGGTRGESSCQTSTSLRRNGMDREPRHQEQGSVLVFRVPERDRHLLALPLLGLYSEGGGEFINAQRLAYCTGRGITPTRPRPYRKNDRCFVGQKNWLVVRQQVGFLRFDTQPSWRSQRASTHLRCT